MTLQERARGQKKNMAANLGGAFCNFSVQNAARAFAAIFFCAVCFMV